MAYRPASPLHRQETGPVSSAGREMEEPLVHNAPRGHVPDKTGMNITLFPLLYKGANHKVTKPSGQG